MGLSHVDEGKTVVARSPDHGKGGKAILGNLEFVSRMVTAVLLCGSEDKTKGGLENVEISGVQKVIEMLKGAVELAIGAIFDEQAGEAQDAVDETLCEWCEVVDLDLGELIVAANIFQDGVEAIEHTGPVVEIAAGPAPFGDAIEHGGQLVIG